VLLAAIVAAVQVWDLGSESVMQQIPVRSSAGASGAPVALERLSAGQSDPRLLLAGCSDGMMRLFDLRASLAPVASIAAGGLSSVESAPPLLPTDSAKAQACPKQGVVSCQGAVGSDGVGLYIVRVGGREAG
jgi:hypothetical protein